MSAEKPPEKRSSKTMVIAGIIVLLIVVGGIAYYLSQPHGQAPMTVETTTEMAGTSEMITTVPTHSTSVVEGFTVLNFAETVTINGAGATFPFPLISKWSVAFNRLYPSVQINYQSIGSGGGIRQFTVKTVDFGATDSPLSEVQYANVTKVSPVLHIPETIGGVVPAYNLPGVGTGLHFTGQVLADIFLGRIIKWNDPALTNLNPGAQLPNYNIVVVHRSDGSGTTFVWTNFLTDANGKWASDVGSGTSVKWPTGVGGKGNEGVAGIIKQNPYALGYNEYSYAVLNKITYGYVQNAGGNFVEPKVETFAAAVAAAAVTLPAAHDSWSHVSIVNAVFNNTGAADAYPIASLTYLLVYQELNVIKGMDEDRAKAIVYFLWWIVHDGQQYSTDLDYVPLPDTVIKIDEDAIRSITFNEQAVFQG